ncbi:MAG: NAD(P)-dependent oxidoreductase [Ktedonobacteraceae bacterium]|nr:NAD(P)-dependent oxidoreductase [Ktedonobacteraceae bacterium]
MNIALFGANGTIGQRILQEALSRGHTVTAIVRTPSKLQISNPGLTIVAGDVLDPISVTQTVAGHDAVISAVGPAHDGSSQADFPVKAAHSLIEGLSRADVQRLLIVGGAGSLEVAPGLRLVDTPNFPAAWYDGAIAHANALDIYKTTHLNWTYLSPAAFIEPGERRGTYRIGTDQLVTDADGKSYITAEDYAVALIDELENPNFSRRRFTLAY